MIAKRPTKILIGPSMFAAEDPTPLQRLVQAGCEIVANPFKRKLTKDELLGLLDEKTAGLVAGLEPLDREVLERSKLRVISRCGSGISNVDLVAAQELGIAVCSTPDAPTAAVAELTLGAMLSLLRMIPEMDRELHQGRWSKKIGGQLEGKTIAIIGMGRIGRHLASLLIPFNVTLLGVDPFLLEPLPSPRAISLVPLATALGQADILSLHCSGEGCVLGPTELSAVKPGAFLLNAARGGLIDEGALIGALEAGRVAGAWLDTFEREPYTGPLTRFPQVILTPHVGSYTRECRRRMELEAVENLLSALANA